MTEINNFIKSFDNYQGFCAVITLIIASSSISVTLVKKIINRVRFGKYKSSTEDTFDFFLYLIQSSVIIPLLSVIISFFGIELFLAVIHNGFKVTKYSTIKSIFLLASTVIINFFMMKAVLNSTKTRKHLLFVKSKVKLCRIFIGIFLMSFSATITFIWLFGNIGNLIGNIILSIHLILIVVVLTFYRDDYYIIKEKITTIYLKNGEIISVKTKHVNLAKDFIQINELDITTTIDRDNISKLVDTYNTTFKPARRTRKNLKKLRDAT